MNHPTLHSVPDDGVAGDSPPAVEVEGVGRVPLGRLLVAQGHLNESQVDDCLFEAGQTGERLGEIVVRRGLLSEEELARVLAEQWGIGYVDRASIWFDGAALAKMSREEAQRLEAMPTRIQEGRVVVAVAEPTDERITALRETVGDDAVFVVVPRSALDAGLSSELLASRAPAAEPAPASEPPHEPPPPLPLPVDLLPPPIYRTDSPPTSPPAPRNEPPPVTPRDAGGDDLDWYRQRVQHLEAELQRQRAVTNEVQLHLQAALRALLLNDLGRTADPSAGGGPPV